MRQESLLCQLRRRFKVTTDSAHSFKSCPNLLKETLIDAPDTAWSADITYVRLPQSFCYLASILDEFSRYCVGWALSRFIDTELTLSALEMALAARRPDPGLIYHSDQGVQYASSDYIERLQRAGARISMAAVGNPYENAKLESFFRTLKMEEVYLKDYRSFEEAEHNIGEFIEEVYNKKRLHSSLGYMPPVEFEALHALRTGS
jgi:putative transposase